MNWSLFAVALVSHFSYAGLAFWLGLHWKKD
jgi:hypothetical protein